MSFLKRLFGGSKDDDEGYSDPTGIYLYVQCDRCQAKVRLRADKQYDLINIGGGYEWHKTVVDSRCFRPMPTKVTFDRDYNVVSAEIEGGRYITEEAYNAPEEPPEQTQTNNDDNDEEAVEAS